MSPQIPADQVVSPDATEAAKEHTNSLSGFYLHLNEQFLGPGCGGASQVYRLLILRSFSESEVIRVAKYADARTFLTHTVGQLGSVRTTVAELPGEAFFQLETAVASTRFLAMETWPGAWGVDADRYVLEWCSGASYYAVDRESDDPEVGGVFDLLKSLAETE